MNNKADGRSLVYTEQIDSQYSQQLYLLFALIIVVGLILRLWGLGNVGLHGDEETTAMPALEILNSGLPLMPSGMLYPRAPVQSYLIALSVFMFGPSEWALRFPSVLAGTLGILFAFFLGKRFLPPKWNLLLVLIIALNPWMITVSQTARMYIFLSTSLILFAVLVFRWEENGSWRRLLAAFIAFLIAQQFHTLAIFSTFLFFFPYLIHPSAKRIAQGLIAFILAFVIFQYQRSFVAGQYGSTLAHSFFDSPDALSPLEFLLSYHLIGTGLILLVCLFTIGTAVYFQKHRTWSFLIGIGFLTVAVGAAFFLQYHIAFLFYCSGIILFVRSSARKVLLCVLTLLLLALFLFQFYLIYDSNLYPSTTKILKAFVGSFSVYPYIVFFGKFPIGLILYAFPVLYAIRRIATGSPVPNHFLFFIISVVLPLVLAGFFSWYFSPRFSFQLTPFFVLSCLAGMFYLEKAVKRTFGSKRLQYAFVVTCFLVLGFIKPFELSGTVNPNCEKFPDHKGAASFMHTVHLNPDDLVLAEDVLQQIYYLGKVDYWLRALDDAKQFVKEKDGILVDIYTHTPLIGTGEKLEELLKDNKRGSIYIIGSGETADFTSYYLSNGILDIINRYIPRAELIYKGCDEKTLIWRIPPLYIPGTWKFPLADANISI